jgi:hypothetical protein
VKLLWLLHAAIFLLALNGCSPQTSKPTQPASETQQAFPNPVDAVEQTGQ